MDTAHEGQIESAYHWVRSLRKPIPDMKKGGRPFTRQGVGMDQHLEENAHRITPPSPNRDVALSIALSFFNEAREQQHSTFDDRFPPLLRVNLSHAPYISG